MAILWRNNLRSAPRGLIYSITHRAYVTAGPDLQTYLYWGELAVGTTGQGGQSIAATGTVVVATAGTAQGTQTIDALGLVTADGPIATGQGANTTDAVMAAVLDALGDAEQGSQSIQAYGDVHTPIPYYGGELRLWRANPRNTQFGLLYSLLPDNMAGRNLENDLFFGVYGLLQTGQGGQTIDAVGSVSGNNVDTGQGSQTIDAVGNVTTASIDATVTTGQGGQSIDAIGPIRASTGQGKQSIDAAGHVDPYYISPVNNNLTLFGTADVYNNNQIIHGPDDFDSLEFGDVEAIGPRSFLFQGYSETEWGVPSVENLTQYIELSSFGFDSQSFGAATGGDTAQYIAHSGWDSFDTTRPFVGILPFQWCQQYDSVDSSEFGDATVNYVGGIRPIGWDSQLFGTAYMEPHQIHPVYDTQGHVGGWDSLGFGRAFVSNFVRNITVVPGFDSFLYGTPWVSFFVRDIYPVGFDRSIVWDQFGPINADNTIPGVYSLGNTIYPVGFDNSELDGCFNLHGFYGEPTVTGGQPRLQASGFDASDFSADYEAADYGPDDYFANDNATKVSHA